MPLASSRHRRWNLLAGTVAAVLLGLGLAADLFVYLSGRRGVLDAPAGAEPAWIVVPGASVRRDGTPSPILEGRLIKALEAATTWPHARILLSGTSIPGGYSEPDAMRAWMIAQGGLDGSRLVLDRAGTSTRATIDHLGPASGRIAVVSQDWHLPRSLWYARGAGWDAVGVVAPQRGSNLKTRLREHVVRSAYFLLGL